MGGLEALSVLQAGGEKQGERIPFWGGRNLCGIYHHARAFALIAGPSKADRIAPHVDSGFDVASSSARAEVK